MSDDGQTQRTSRLADQEMGEARYTVEASSEQQAASSRRAGRADGSAGWMDGWHLLVNCFHGRASCHVFSAVACRFRVLFCRQSFELLAYKLIKVSAVGDL